MYLLQLPINVHSPVQHTVVKTHCRFCRLHKKSKNHNFTSTVIIMCNYIKGSLPTSKLQNYLKCFLHTKYLQCYLNTMS